MNLGELLAPSFRGRCDHAALDWNGDRFTFGAVDEKSDRMAAVLQARGVAKGDRVCAQLPNSVDLITLFLACVRIGAVFVPINVLYRHREVAHITEDAQPRLSITESDLVWLREAPAVAVQEIAIGGNDPAAIIYTSGTTGPSKGAVLSHGNFAANAVNLISAWRITDSDRLLLALPLFHVHGLGNGLLTWLAAGYHVRLLERFDHASAADELLDYAPTLFFGVPAMYVRLLETPLESARHIGAVMRLFVSGSAPLPAQVFEAFRQRFGHAILERYGMSETLMNISNPYEGDRRAGTVGLPLPGVSVRMEKEELLVRGPNVFSGYWRKPEATAAAFTSDGWFRTGDLASVSADGYYTLIGRRSEVIISGGFNIYPREIEELLLEQPGVREAAVIGEPDRIRGEVPVAFVVGDFDPRALEEVCRANLASFKAPRRFEKVTAIPRTALGKVQKHLLK